MAGFATHDIFGREVIEKVSDDMLKSILKKHIGVFGIGCQGPDLFLYNLPMHVGNGEKNLGSRMHNEGSSKFFAYLLWTIWNTEDYEFMEDGLSYLYGALAHYTLDTMMHPYIYARIGFDPSIPYSRRATAGIHHRLEAAIDAKMIAVKEDMLPSRYQPLNSITINKEEKKALSELLSRTVSKSYHIRVRKENVTSSLKMMRMIVCSFYGCSEKHKKRLERLEGTFFEDYLCSNFLVSDEYIKKRKIMNTENEEWLNPWELTVISKDSVWEIYDNAVLQYEEYLRLLQPLIPVYLRKWVSLRHPYYAYCKRDKKEAAHAHFDMPGKAMEEMSSKELWKMICQIAKKLGNLSYHSGLPIEDN